MKDAIIGRIAFTDGVERDVYFTSDGGQYVLDAAALPVASVWILEDGTEDTAMDVVRNREEINAANGTGIQCGRMT